MSDAIQGKVSIRHFDPNEISTCPYCGRERPEGFGCCTDWKNWVRLHCSLTGQKKPYFGRLQPKTKKSYSIYSERSKKRQIKTVEQMTTDEREELLAKLESIM